MKIIISATWLTACGHSDWIGHAFEAVHIPSKSHSSMGDFYEVITPTGGDWCVFSGRGVTVCEEYDEPGEPEGDIWAGFRVNGNENGWTP